MILCDVNVLLYAFRRDAERHEEYRAWLESVLRDAPTFGVAEMVLASVIRISTHPRIYREPSTLEEVGTFAQYLTDQPNAVRIRPGSGHWDLFTSLCRKVGTRGNLVADAYLAALAIESGCEWITTDRDFARFPGLRWRHPLDPPSS